MSQDSIMIDARWLRSGIGRYTLGLLRKLREHLPASTLWCMTNESYRPLLEPLCDRVLVSNSSIYSVGEQLSMPRAARGMSLFHSPHYNFPVLWRGKLVVTIHDLNHLLDDGYRRHWKSRLYAWPMLLSAVKKADHIFTVSEYSKAMLVEHLGCSPEKIAVTGCSVAAAFRPLAGEEVAVRLQGQLIRWKPYCLYVGDLRPNKNVATLLEALSIHRNNRKDALSLVLAGGTREGWNGMMPLVEKLGLRRAVQWLPSVSDATLAALYSGAAMTILPSFQEGFGLPVIESMSCGTPVICSNAASLPEVAAGAALLFDPSSAEDLAAKMESLLGSTEMQQKLSAAGLQRAAFFTEDRQAALHAKVYQSILEG